MLSFAPKQDNNYRSFFLIRVYRFKTGGMHLHSLRTSTYTVYGLYVRFIRDMYTLFYSVLLYTLASSLCTEQTKLCINK